jgi:hypothetical protein
VVKALVEATPISGPARVRKLERGLAHDGRFRHVADGQGARLAEALGVLERGQGVGGLAGLRDGDDQGFRIRHGSAIAVFAGDLDAAGKPAS